VLRRQGLYPEALDRLERAFRLSPREARLAFAVSDTLASMRNYAEAMEWSDRGLELAPATSSAHLNRAIMSLSWRGDLDRAEAELDLAGTASGGSVAFLRFTLHLYRREAAGGLEALRHLPVESLEMVELRLPRTLLEGVLLRLDGDDEGAAVAFETARSLISAALEVEPDDARLHSALGLALAGLGRREEALEAGQRGVELCPRDTDALLGPFRVWDLALIAATVGERDVALASLDDVLSNPGEHSGWDLRLDPRFDGLRDDPRFKRLAPSRQ
jgi:tetratricopeptide (TPR) repeat protein